MAGQRCGDQGRVAKLSAGRRPDAETACFHATRGLASSSGAVPRRYCSRLLGTLLSAVRLTLARDDDQARGRGCCFSAKEQSWRTAWRARSLLSWTRGSSGPALLRSMEDDSEPAAAALHGCRSAAAVDRALVDVCSCPFRSSAPLRYAAIARFGRGVHRRR